MPLIITGKPLLLCEGNEDSALVAEMIRVRGLQKFDVSVVEGIGRLREHLEDIVRLSNFKEVAKICLLADSDEGEPKTIKLIRDHFIKANTHRDVRGRYPLPAMPFKRASHGKLSLTVILQPGGNKPGCLETLLWTVLQRLHKAEAECVEALIDCAGIAKGKGKWGLSKLDKARVRAAIAIILKNNPALALSYLWQYEPSLIPITSPEFDAVFQHLAAI